MKYTEKRERIEHNRKTRLEEKVLRKEIFNLDKLKGQKLYFSMNDSKTYTGIYMTSFETSIGYMILLEDVSILENDTRLEHVCLDYGSISAWWPEDRIKKGLYKPKD